VKEPKYNVDGTPKKRRRIRSELELKMTSRRFIAVIMSYAIMFTSLLLQAWEFIPVLTVLAAGITSYIGISTFFKEKNYKPEGTE
jgi:hypothetical protein